MKIPKTIHRNNHTYTFIEKCNDKLYRYQCDLGFYETFDLYDLELLDNTKIDKKIGRRTWEEAIYVVYDSLLHEEKEYKRISEISEELNVLPGTISEKIRNHRWLYNRWFIERRYKD